MKEAKFQIGKNGLTESLVDTLLLAFKNYKQIRIAVLKSSGRDKNSINKIADNVISSLSRRSSYYYTHRIIGFTIIIKKHSSNR